MSSSPPERRSVVPADLETIAELTRACEQAAGLEPSASPADLRDWLSAVDLPADSLVLELDGRMAACGWVFVRDELAYAHGSVWPDLQGRGLGVTLLDFHEERARVHAAESLLVDVLAGDERAGALLRSRGYDAVKRFCELAIDLEQPPEAPSWPEGVTVAPFRREDARVFYDTIDEVFADDWSFVSLPYDTWYDLRVVNGDTGLWFLAREAGEVVGVVRCERERRGVGWVGALAVRESWRSRGIGRALLLHALAAFRSSGRDRVGLGVDAGNPGALQLYESIGMRIVAEEIVYERACNPMP